MFYMNFYRKIEKQQVTGNMDIRGYPWIFLDIHGYPWIFMDIHGYWTLFWHERPF